MNDSKERFLSTAPGAQSATSSSVTLSNIRVWLRIVERRRGEIARELAVLQREENALHPSLAPPLSKPPG